MGGLAGPGSRENMVFTENGFELKSVIYPKQPATQTAGKLYPPWAWLELKWVKARFHSGHPPSPRLWRAGKG